MPSISKLNISISCSKCGSCHIYSEKDFVLEEDFEFVREEGKTKVVFKRFVINIPEDLECKSSIK